MKPSHKKQTDTEEISNRVDNKKIVVFNDDVNTFDHVIQTLISICEHTSQQAEQCAWIVHHRGECIVKQGDSDELSSQCMLLCEAGIDAKVL